MHRSTGRQRLFNLLIRLVRSAIPWSGVLLLLSRAELAAAQAVVVPAEGVSQALAEATSASALHIVNELSNRRRLTTFFVNEQSPFYGVQINYVNAGRGNLTFLNRDLVRLDRIPIVAGRVYDSRLAGESDFGPGWKLSVSEVIHQHGTALQYIDASGSVYELQLAGTQIVSPYPHLTGISSGRRRAGDIELSTGRFTKRFTNIRGDFYLATVTDALGNSLHLQYSGTQVSRISSENGRYVEVVRDTSGRITSLRDDAGRVVAYQYDPAGQLYSVRSSGQRQWRYRYGANGHLQGVTDPRGIDALTASYAQDGRVSDVRVLYDVMSFSYQGPITSVRNGLQQEAVFWHHESGMTDTIQDFSGSTSQMEFGSSLKPASLSFDGAVVAALRYGDNGKVQEVRSSIEGRPQVTRFSYDGAGRLAAVMADGQPIAGYTYDSGGRPLRAEDTAGARAYEYFGSTGHQIRFGETELDIETNDQGLMGGFSNGHQSVAISYNDSDQVSDVTYVEYGDVYEVSYTYAASGLRSGGSYLIAEDQPAPANLSLDYDVVGNLTNLGLATPSGAATSQTYVLGVNNQLSRLINPRRPDAVFEYDSAGRPTRRTLGTSYASYNYDSLGRITAVYERDRKILEWRYGPMDVDAATEADDHTPWTAINEPIASAIFGSVESIAYARTRGTPFGPIRFSATMARFVLPVQPIPRPDGVMLVSLQRRNVPLSSDHHTNASPAPLGFDKPSNALFLPPEFSSLNCYMCVAWISGAQLGMYINGVPYGAGTPWTYVGGLEVIEVVGSGHCYGDVHWYNHEAGQWEIDTVTGIFTHYWDFEDGNGYSEVVDPGTDPDRTAYYAHGYSGLFHVTDTILCSCADGTMFFYDVMGAGQDVLVIDPPPPPCNPGAVYAALYNRFAPRSPTIRSQYGMSSDGTTFSFAFLTAFQGATSEEQEQFLSGGMAWTTNGVACNTYYCVGNVQATTENQDVDVVLVDDIPVSGACGRNYWVGESGRVRDEIQLLRTGVNSSLCDNHRVETAYHEIGHLLGFVHLNAPEFSTTDLYQNPRPAGGIRTIQGHHLRILAERYQ